MLGQAHVDYDSLMMQLDVATGDYDDLGEQTLGFKGPTLSYRKVEGLEVDPVFGELVRHPVAADICRHVYGQGVAISTFRSMFMNKPSSAGTPLPWHQDRWVWLDRDPLVTVYTALDAATEDSGCVHVIFGSHHSIVNPLDDSSFLEEKHYAEHCPLDRERPIELEAGEMVLFHNWLIHRSAVNRTAAPRRAFSVCYMEARTIDYLDKHHPVVFDSDGRPSPVPNPSTAT
jgi:ectoine hydroxylase-related dioxygenase (phytanoyl-CoA dioxygenase family)